MFRRPVSLIVAIAFIVTSLSMPPQASAQGLLGLPEPGSMVLTSAAFQPVMLKGLTVHKENPFLFDFIVDMGQVKIHGDALKAEGDKLIKYFMATLAIPEKDLWVNLSPYEKDRTIPEALGQTDMGRDLLAQDYILKQLTASLIYPEKELGKKFWDKVYTQMQAQYGKTVNIPVNTFNKVWIMADKAEVFERNQTALVTSSHLKVMLEEDYLAAQRHAAGPASEQSILSSRHPSPGGVAEPRTTLPLAARTKQPASESPALASQVIKEIILPAIEREVNEGQNFASLRQIFNSIILASWYKNNLKDSLLNEAYSNKATVKGIDLTDKTIKQQIYERYLQAYKKGVFNYIKDEPAHGTQVPRKYFSGGIVAQLTLGKANEAMAAAEIRRNSSQYVRMVASLDPAQRPTADAAMRAADIDALVRTRNVKEIVRELKILNGVTRFDFDGVRDLAERIAQDDQLYAQVFAAMDASKKKHAPGAGEISRDNSILEALQQARILNNTGLNRASLNIAQEEARKALSLSANQKLIVDTKSIATVLSNIFHQDMKTGEKPGKVFVKEAQGNVVPLNKASEALSRILNTRGLVPVIIFSAENGYSPKKAYLAFLPKADNAMSAAPSFSPIYQEMIKNLQQPKGNTIAITSLLLQSKDKTNPKPAFMQGMLDGSLGLPPGAGYMLGQNWQIYPDSADHPNNRQIVLGWARAKLDEANGIDLRQGQEMGINGDREKIRAFLFDVVQSSNTVTLYINGKPYFKAQDRDDIIILPDVFLNAVAKLGAVTFHVKAWRDNLKWAVDISTEPQGVKDQAMTADEAHQLFDQAGVKKAFETMGRITNNGLFVEDGKIKWAWDVNVNLADEALRQKRLAQIREIVARFVQEYTKEYDITVDVPAQTDMKREDIVTFYIAKKDPDAAMTHVEVKQLLDAGKLDEVLNEYLSYFKQYSQKNRQRLLEMTDTIVTHQMFENSMFEEALEKAAAGADRWSNSVYEDAAKYLLDRRTAYDQFKAGEALDDFKINWESTRPSKEETINLQRLQLQTLRAIASAVLESKWYGGAQIVVTDGNILLAKFLEGLLRNVSHTLEFDKEGKEARISILDDRERQRFEQEAIANLIEQEGVIAFYGSRIAKVQAIQEKLTAVLAPEELSAVRLSLSRTGQISIIVPSNEALKEKVASLVKDNVTQVAWHRIPDVLIVSDAAMLELTRSEVKDVQVTDEEFFWNERDGFLFNEQRNIRTFGGTFTKEQIRTALADLKEGINKGITLEQLRQLVASGEQGRIKAGAMVSLINTFNIGDTRERIKKTATQYEIDANDRPALDEWVSLQEKILQSPVRDAFRRWVLLPIEAEGKAYERGIDELIRSASEGGAVARLRFTNEGKDAVLTIPLSKERSDLASRYFAALVALTRVIKQAALASTNKYVIKIEPADMTSDSPAVIMLVHWVDPDAAMLAPDPSRAQTSPMLKEVDQWQTIPLVVSGVEYQGGINAVLNNVKAGKSMITLQPGGSVVDVSVSIQGNITDDGARLSFIKLAFEALRDKLLADPNVAGRYDLNVNMEFGVVTPQGTRARLTDTVTMTVREKSAVSDAAMKAPGGIDLQRSGANTNVLKEGKGVEFKLDPALIEQVRREGIQSLTPVILRVEPAVNIGILLGLVP